MAFGHLVFILRSYLRHGYKHVLVTDLKEAKIRDILETFGKEERLLVNLVANDSVIRRRIGSRTEGFTNVEAASAYSQRIVTSPPLWENEV